MSDRPPLVVIYKGDDARLAGVREGAAEIFQLLGGDHEK